MHRVRRRCNVSFVAIPIIAGTCVLIGASPARTQTTQNVATDIGYVSGGLSVSLSERALTDALQRSVLPALRDSLSRALHALPGATVESLLRAAGTPGPIPDTHGASFEEVRWDPSTLQLRVDLVEPDTLRVAAQSGPLVFVMSAETCYGNCLVGCCLRSRARFEVRMQDVWVDLALTPVELLNGAGEMPGAGFGHPHVDIRGLEVDFGTPHVGGVVGWLSGAAVLAEVFNLFGVPRALLGAFAGETIVANIQEPLEDAILEQFPLMEFDGLASLGLAPDLPPTAPVRLDTHFGDTPEIRAGDAILVQVGTVFAPQDTRIDPASYLVGTVDAGVGAALDTGDAAAGLDAATLGADVAIATNEDAVNQLLAALASSGSTRARFDGLRVGELAPGMSIPMLGIGPETPVSIAIDAAREENGQRLAPHIEFMDDPATTDVLEARVRLRMTVRGILQRGQPVEKDSTLCTCLDRAVASSQRPCVLSEGDVDLDLIIGARLEATDHRLALVRVAVTEVRELAVVEPLTVVVAADSSVAAVDSIPMGGGTLRVVNSSETSPVLALVRDRLNALSMPIPVPLDVLTLGGWMDITNLRLFTTPDDSTTGSCGYLGILADLDTGGDAEPVIAQSLEMVAPPEPESVAVALADPGASAAAVPVDAAAVPAADAAPSTAAVPVTDAAADAAPSAASVPNTDSAPRPATVPASAPPPEPARPPRFTRWDDPTPAGTATIRAGMPSESSWLLTIYDGEGRPVRRLRGHGGPGYVEIAWDGRSEDGRAVSGGDYVYHFETQGYEVSRRLQLGE